MKQVIFNRRYGLALNDRQTVDYLPGQPYSVDDAVARAVVKAGAASIVAAPSPAPPKKKHGRDLQD